VQIKANIELDAGSKTFANGLLPELIDALQRCRPGDLLAIVSSQPSVGDDLATWCRFTRNALIGEDVDAEGSRFIIRRGEAPVEHDADRQIGSRLWLYTNFDCNLQCSYCCVRSSPKTPRRALGLVPIQRIAKEAAELGVKEIFVTGGEPFLLPEVGDILRACAAASPTTVLTNGMLFSGRRLETLRSLPRDRLTLQISLDSPTPKRHDSNRGTGTWMRAWKGIERASAEGFRVRLAATVSSDAEADEFRAFLDAHQIHEQDRIIRRIALRGFATEGMNQLPVGSYTELVDQI
jgi:sulfatase maturation enzyme AslB (radical SAM superfamily)/TusA-related sulfurtransferase